MAVVSERLAIDLRSAVYLNERAMSDIATIEGPKITEPISEDEIDLDILPNKEEDWVYSRRMMEDDLTTAFRMVDKNFLKNPLRHTREMRPVIANTIPLEVPKELKESYAKAAEMWGDDYTDIKELPLEWINVPEGPEYQGYRESNATQEVLVLKSKDGVAVAYCSLVSNENGKKVIGGYYIPRISKAAFEKPAPSSGHRELLLTRAAQEAEKQQDKNRSFESILEEPPVKFLSSNSR